MPPCPVCGDQDVDPTGYCVTCGTFRAASEQPAEPAPRKAPRSPFLVPLIALSGTLAVLVAAIVIVVQIRKSDKDLCIVGTWLVTSHREDVEVPGAGKVAFTGQGARVTLRPDGTGRTDYGTAGTTYRGTANGRTIELTITKTVTFRFAADGTTVRFTDVQADGEGIVTVDGREVVRRKFQGGADPAEYTCAGDRLTERTNLYEVVLTRES